MSDVVFATSASDRRLARAPGKVSRRQQRIVLRRQERISKRAPYYAHDVRRQPRQWQEQQMPSEALNDTPRTQPVSWSLSWASGAT